VKTDHELELMQIANDVTMEIFKLIPNMLLENMTEQVLSRALAQTFAMHGFQGGALVLFGQSSAHPHGLVKENKLKVGDIVLIDGGCSVEGYMSDVTRTMVFASKPTDKMQRVFDVVKKAQSAALAVARPGVPAENIDAAARSVIEDAGFGPQYTYFTHRLGHGIGMEGHEWYYLVRGNKRPVVHRNVFSNEPGIYIPGEFGIRLEDEMLITEDGAKLLLPQAETLEDFFGAKLEG
jgi:Xaa-Pro dipeptidase